MVEIFSVEYKTFICLPEWLQFIPQLDHSLGLWTNIYIFFKYRQVTISAVPECGVILSLCLTDSTAHGMG